MQWYICKYCKDNCLKRTLKKPTICLQDNKPFDGWKKATEEEVEEILRKVHTNMYH